jgi:hypothetical protein
MASSKDSKPEPTLSSVLPTLSSAFCPHEAGAYYLATVRTVGKVINLFAKEIEPLVYTYAITTIHFEQDPDTSKWVWFDGKEKLSPRKNQDGWRLGSKKLYDSRDGAEAEFQRVMVKNGDRVTKVHDLPDCMTQLRKIRSAHHPDRNNPDSDHDLYQPVIEKIDRPTPSGSRNRDESGTSGATIRNSGGRCRGGFRVPVGIRWEISVVAGGGKIGALEFWIAALPFSPISKRPDAIDA